MKISPIIERLPAYQPGKPISEVQRLYGLDTVTKLASNENPYGPARSVLKKLALKKELLLRYPDGNAFALKQALARWHNCNPEQITVGNGSNDVLDLITRIFAGKNKAVLFSQYAFAVYPLSAMAVGAPLQIIPAVDYAHDLQQFAQGITQQTTLIFIANPNNPTGTFLEKKALYSFLQQVPEHIAIVLDEAYSEYLLPEQCYDSVAWLQAFPNLIITRTFSKAYGLAGLRVGYALSSEKIADWLNRVRHPFNVNSVALLAAEYALEDQDWIQQTIEQHFEQKSVMEKALQGMNMRYLPSSANFLTIALDNGSMQAQKLLEQGIVVRDLDAYKMPDHVRVSIGTAAENNRLLDALSAL